MSTTILNNVNPEEVSFKSINRGQMFLGEVAHPSSPVAVSAPKDTLFIRITDLRNGSSSKVNAIRIQDGAHFEFLQSESVIPVDVKATVSYDYGDKHGISNC